MPAGLRRLGRAVLRLTVGAGLLLGGLGAFYASILIYPLEQASRGFV